MTPNVLVCAGLDPSGGAGFIADVRVAALLETRPVGVITALTVQNTEGVFDVAPVAAETVREQLERLLSDVEVRAVKLGMLGSVEVARAVGEALALTAAPVIWDPVGRSSRGAATLTAALPEVLRVLSHHLALVTPNTLELEALGGLAALGDVPVLIKGGHAGTADATDVLIANGTRLELVGERIADGEHVHGTGCALATAIAAHLARGCELAEACRAAKQFVADRIANPIAPGRGAASVV